MGINFDMNPNTTMETTIKAHLPPVHPDPIFINSLRSKLNSPNQTILDSHKQSNVIWLILLGMITGLLIVWLIAGLRKLLRNSN